jgi:cobalt-zinc-cadmium efflux system membrane fusion protein
MDRFFVVEDGLEEGEEIVTVGSFLLKTEILKGSIGAGCCEIDLGKE